jgi:hypothetical protein
LFIPLRQRRQLLSKPNLHRINRRKKCGYCGVVSERVRSFDSFQDLQVASGESETHASHQMRRNARSGPTAPSIRRTRPSMVAGSDSRRVM